MDKAGARNAAWMAAQILALAGPRPSPTASAPPRAKMQADVEKARRRSRSRSLEMMLFFGGKETPFARACF